MVNNKSTKPIFILFAAVMSLAFLLVSIGITQTVLASGDSSGGGSGGSSGSDSGSGSESGGKGDSGSGSSGDSGGSSGGGKGDSGNDGQVVDVDGERQWLDGSDFNAACNAGDCTRVRETSIIDGVRVDHYHYEINDRDSGDGDGDSPTVVSTGDFNWSLGQNKTATDPGEPFNVTHTMTQSNPIWRAVYCLVSVKAPNASSFTKLSSKNFSNSSYNYGDETNWFQAVLSSLNITETALAGGGGSGRSRSSASSAQTFNGTIPQNLSIPGEWIYNFQCAQTMSSSRVAERNGELVVTDSRYPQNVKTLRIPHEVNEPPLANPRCSTSPTSAQTGQEVIRTASVSGGNGIYSYRWRYDVTSQNSNRITTRYNTAGTKRAQVWITSGSRESGWINCPNVTISNPPPVASLEVRNLSKGTGWTTGTIRIDPIDQIELAWNRTNGAQNTASCSGTNFATGNRPQGTNNNINTPAEGSASYRVDCDNVGGTITLSSNTIRVDIEEGRGADIEIDEDRVRKDDEVDVTWDTGTSRPDSCQIRIGTSVILRDGLENAPNPLTITIPGEATVTLDCPGGNDASDSVQIIPEYQET